MALHLVRHASAGKRAGWNGPDDERPLDERGRAEAEAISLALEGRSIGRILSSPAVRCLQTMAALAHRSGLEIEVVEELREDAPIATTLALVRACAGSAEDVALCSHGDVIPAVLSTLLEDGMAVRGERGCAKGSIWQLETRDLEICSATYRAPESLTTPDRAPI